MYKENAQKIQFLYDVESFDDFYMMHTYSIYTADAVKILIIQCLFWSASHFI